MTIKKPMKTQMPTVEAAPMNNATVSGAAIADRFKLDMTNPSAKAKPANGMATTIALVAALLALAVAGFLTFLLYQHFEFLKAA